MQQQGGSGAQTSQTIITIFVMAVLIFGGIFLAAMLNAKPIGAPTTPPVSPPESEGTNIFEGYGDTPEAGNANIRRAESNEFINSQTVPDLQLKCKVDVASIYNLTYLPGSQFNGGRRGMVQVSETHSYLTLGSIDVLGFYVSYLIAINRETCAIDAVVSINDVNSQAVARLAQKYPSEYDQGAVDAFQRDPADGFCFSPIVLSGNRIITGDGCTHPGFFSDAYYDSRPQANGGPVLGKSWGVTTPERHLLGGNVYVLDATTLQLLDADRVVDAGEAEAVGNVNVNGVVGVPQVVVDDEVDEATYVVVGSHAPTIFGIWTRLDRNAARREVGKLNGNRPTNRNSLKRFRLYDNGTIVENWRVYDTPQPLMGGDPHPMDAMLVLANDTEADELNYYGSGFAHSAAADLDRRQLIVTAGTAYLMPGEAAVAAYLARGTWNAQTGGLGYPKCTHTEWTRLFASAVTTEQQQSLYADFKQTQVNREEGLRLLLNNERYDEVLLDSVAVLDLDDGSIKWTKRRVATNSEAAATNWVESYGVAFDSEDYVKAQYLAGSGDHDWDMAAVHVIGDSGPDFYSLGATDGSIQILDPDTGSVVSDIKVLTGQWAGSINTGGTIDDAGNVYFSGQWHRTLNNLSDLNHITKINRTTVEIQVDENANCPLDASSTCVDSDSLWYSNAFVDTFNDLGNGAGGVYINQEVPLPDSVGLLFSAPVPYAATALAVTRDPVGERNAFPGSTDPPLLGEAVLTSVNDVLIATHIYGNIQFWDMTTMTPIRIIDLLPDVQAIPGHPGHVTCSSGVAVAGREVWFACGEVGLNGSGPGAFVYSYSV